VNKDLLGGHSASRKTAFIKIERKDLGNARESATLSSMAGRKREGSMALKESERGLEKKRVPAMSGNNAG